MELLVFVLYNHEKLDEVLTSLEESGIKGATIIDSTGMAKVLHHDEETSLLFGAIRNVLNNPSRSKSNTIFMVLEKEDVDVAVKAIEKVIGDLNRENVGIIFSIPVDYTKGINGKSGRDE